MMRSFSAKLFHRVSISTVSGIQPKVMRIENMKDEKDKKVNLKEAIKEAQEKTVPIVPLRRHSSPHHAAPPAPQAKRKRPLPRRRPHRFSESRSPLETERRRESAKI